VTSGLASASEDAEVDERSTAQNTQPARPDLAYAPGDLDPREVRVRRVGLVTLVLLVLAGCGYNSGLLQDSATGNQVQFRMDISSERYSRTVYGSSSVVSVFCVIPLEGGLYARAMHALHGEARLRPNEALQNLRLDSDPSCFLLFGIRHLIISADVYEMTPVGGPPPPSQAYAPAPGDTATTDPAPARPARGVGRQCLGDGSCDTGERCVFPADGGAGAMGHCAEAK
jgi:hypothetical protein